VQAKLEACPEPVEGFILSLFEGLRDRPAVPKPQAKAGWAFPTWTSVCEICRL